MIPRMIRLSFVALAPAFALSAFGASASAHIELLDPPPRYTMARSGDNKACPCGDGTSNRRCNVEGERSDDNRSDRVTALTGGEMLTVRFSEYVGHSGRFRVAFDDDGADLEDFNAHSLEDIPDPPGKDGNTGDGSIWEIPVMVPNMTCENCTLQLIQMMDGNMEDPVDDPVGRSSYYACADITISASASAGSDEGDSGGTEAASDAGGCNIARRAPNALAQAAVVAASCLAIALRRLTPARRAARSAR